MSLIVQCGPCGTDPHQGPRSTFESVGRGVEGGLTRFWYGSQKCEWEGEEVSEKTTPYGKSGPWTPETPPLLLANSVWVL